MIQIFKDCFLLEKLRLSQSWGGNMDDGSPLALVLSTFLEDLGGARCVSNLYFAAQEAHFDLRAA